MLSIIPIFPDDVMWEQNFCMTHFDINLNHLEEIGGGGENFKKSILTNIRQVAAMDEKKQPSYNISLLAPSEPKEGTEETADVPNYEWIRDFKVELAAQHDNTYIFSFDSDKSLFCPARSAALLKRLIIEESVPYDAIVKRRKLNLDEDLELKILQKEIS